MKFNMMMINTELDLLLVFEWRVCVVYCLLCSNKVKSTKVKCVKMYETLAIII